MNKRIFLINSTVYKCFEEKYLKKKNSRRRSSGEEGKATGSLKKKTKEIYKWWNKSNRKL